MKLSQSTPPEDGKLLEDLDFVFMSLYNSFELPFLANIWSLIYFWFAPTSDDKKQLYLWTLFGSYWYYTYQFVKYLQTAEDYGGPRKEFFSLILPMLFEKYFEPMKPHLEEDYETVGKIFGTYWK